jgi:hypothetical protein
VADLADVDDLAARLGRDLTEAELAAAPALIGEASALVAGYLGRDWPELENVPATVRVASSRMVARAMTAGSVNLPAGTSEFGSALSVMSHTFKLGDDVVIGSPWLSRTDKTTLAPYVMRPSVVNVPMYHVVE